MKRLFLFAALILAFFVAGHAAEFALRKAVADFVKSKDIKVSKSLTKGFDPASGDNGPRRWTLIKYEFEGQPKVMKSRIDKLIDAYEVDLSKTQPSDLFNAYLLHDGSLDADIFIKYSDRIDPLDIDYSDNLLLLSVVECEGINTIIVVQWEDLDEDSSTDCEGWLYIIERDPAFATWVEYTATVEYNENLSRLAFYASKYLELKGTDFSTAITEATAMVVKDIIRSGCEVDIEMAKPILDKMIAAPLDIYSIPVSMRPERKRNQQTLVNLLKSLSSEPYVLPDTQYTFVIEGTIDPELWDIGYNIRMNSDGLDVNPDIVDVVNANGKSFHYSKELSEIRIGRLTANMKDGTECSASMQFLFVPGETAIVNVHNGHFSLGGSSFYKDYSYGSQNRSLKDSPDKQVDFARQNIALPGVICALFAENIVTDPAVRKQIFEMLPEETKSGKYGTFLRKYL